MNDGQVLAKENFPEGKLVFKPNLSFRESLVMPRGRATRAQGTVSAHAFSPEKRELLIYMSLNRINGLD